MIPADKSQFVSEFLARDAEKRIKRVFGHVYASGLDATAAALSEAPALIVMNHTSWWDPLVLQYLSTRVWKVDAYAMMDAKNLERFPFFRKVGAFGVDLTSPTDGLRAMRYAAKLLVRPKQLVWVFPQGAEVPITVRPLGFRAGSAEIARLVKRAKVIPAAVRYEFGKDPEPSLYLSFGPPLPVENDRERGRLLQENAVTEELRRIEQAIVGGDRAFIALHERRESALLAWATRLLSFLTRPRKGRRHGASP